jgi:hypothetical protein
MTARLVTLLLAISAVSCEGDGTRSPTAPTPGTPVQIAGTWAGTYRSGDDAATGAGNMFRVISPITMNLNQTGSTITGTWASTLGNERGTVSGTVDSASFVGTITYAFDAEPACEGAFSGLSTVGTLNWSSPGMTGDCWLASPGNPLAMRFVLQR